ncbi:MAG: fibronectin type III domain-containing protein [Euryarchaeota archaeon]|nr:fibronectin type III domain-containing protein [Euryarchaeota archaeon]
MNPLYSCKGSGRERRKTASFLPTLIVALLTLQVVLPTFSETALADSGSVMAESADLPSKRWGTSAVFTGTHAFLFGGSNGGPAFYDDIQRFDPEGATWATMGARLPSGRADTSAVWTGSKVYIFGGRDRNGTDLDDILEYDPALDVLTVAPAKLPQPMTRTSAIWAEPDAYVFGGFNAVSRSYSTKIFRYSPATGSVTVIPAALPSPRCCTSAIYDGSKGHIFGGYDGGNRSDQILRFDPVVGALTVSAARLPTPRAYTSAVWNGEHAYVLGGTECLENCHDVDEVVRYETTAGGVVKMSATMWPPVTYASAVWMGDEAYVFGGLWRQSVRDEVWSYNIAPGAPRYAYATTKNAHGSLEVLWLPPFTNSYSSPLHGYRLYRGTAPDALAELATMGNRTTYTDQPLPDNTTFYYQLAAFNSRGDGAKSAIISARTLARSVPTVPLALTVLPGPSPGKITVSWNPPAKDSGAPILAYRVYRGETNTTHPFLTEIGNVTSFVDQGLGHGAKRFYRVSAVNGPGEGPLASAQGGTTFNVSSKPLSFQALPGPAMGQVKLSWKAPADDGRREITGYNIYRGTSPGALGLVGTLSPKMLLLDEKGLPDATIHYYEVVAVNAMGEGEAATAAASTYVDTVPEMPRELTASRGNNTAAFNTVNLAWKSPIDNGGPPTIGYYIYRSDDSGAPGKLIEVGATGVYVDTEVEPLTKYYYRIGAKNILGAGIFTDRVGVVTGYNPKVCSCSPGAGAYDDRDADGQKDNGEDLRP